jgi:ABC-type lipoprotein release transport system permease subunit
LLHVGVLWTPAQGDGGRPRSTTRPAAGARLNAGAWAQAPLLERFLFGVRPAEPVFVLAASLLLIAVGLVAAAVPARRASRLDPVKLLRSE